MTQADPGSASSQQNTGAANQMNAALGSLGEISQALMSLFRAQFKLGSDVIESMTGLSVESLADQTQKRARGLTRGCCDIPPPCWLPQPIGECVSHVSPCKKACIRLEVTNCDRVKRTIRVDASQHADKITISPSTLPLGPMECATVTVCLEVPKDAKVGDQFKTIVWVRGCREHYLRWTVSVGTLGMDSCHQLEVDDCPDHIHHWYDHFYCPRPCTHPQRTDGSTGDA